MHDSLIFGHLAAGLLKLIKLMKALNFLMCVEKPHFKCFKKKKKHRHTIICNCNIICNEVLGLCLGWKGQ